jgi:hypothetical protein
MKYYESNSPEFIVSDATPLAREILKKSLRLASELAAKNSPCTRQEYLSYVTNASTVLTKIAIHNLYMDGQNA